jgi:hypothetical protein
MTEQQEWSKKVIQKTCEILNLSEEIVTIVHKDQWKRCRTAAKECNQVEFSGLGRIEAKQNRLKKQLLKFQNLYNKWIRIREVENDPAKAHSLGTKIDAMTPVLENLKKRLKKFENED